jgi:formamidopyrimidine-DNA glycosylase
MPELPEVETVRAGLAERFCARPTIVRARLLRPDIRAIVPPELPSRLAGQPIVGVRRRAKYLLIDTPAATLLCHLGMTGSWRAAAPGDAIEDKHDHFYLELDDGQRLAFRDPRRFGLLDLVEPGAEAEHPRLRGLGPEPLEAGLFDAHYLRARARGRSAAVKAFLMDQRTVVGVGNIYASEALFRARVRPQRRAGRVAAAEWLRIVDAIRSVLGAAIAAGGSSIRDYRGADGRPGAFQAEFLVYGREGEPCAACKGALKAKTIGGRSSFYCPRCQA